MNEEEIKEVLNNFDESIEKAELIRNPYSNGENFKKILIYLSEEHCNIFKDTLDYINQLQSNWNSLREWLKNKIDNFQDDVSEPILHEQMTMRVIYEYMENLDKMNELEGKNN